MEYDCVIVSRFDAGQRSKVHRGYNVSEIPFSGSLDMNYLYSAMWMQLNAGYADQWFFSNSNNIDKLVEMHLDSLTDYFQKDSEYYQSLSTGWPDSNADDEFSNEMLKSEKTENLVKYPRWQMINNHLLHKWHIRRIGLSEKSKFLNYDSNGSIVHT